MIYFTSDWHLNESRLFDFNPFFRPFESIEQQNDTIIHNMNFHIGEDDVLYHIGDVAMDIDGVNLLSKIKCKNKYLIIGNYDEPYLDALSKYFVIENNLIINLNGKEYVLNHYPSLIKEKEFGIVGHIHGLWKVQKNMINVSVDAWHFKPVSENEIAFTLNAINNHYDKNVFPN
jgi:calcineurin-like phosphoesterase family protein